MLLLLQPVRYICFLILQENVSCRSGTGRMSEILSQETLLDLLGVQDIFVWHVQDLLACVLHQSEKSMKNITNIEQLPIEKYRCRLRAWSSSVLLCIALLCLPLGFCSPDQGTPCLAKQQK